MILLKALATLVIFTPVSQAAKRADIFCKSRTVLADTGAIVEIVEEQDGGFHYTFTHNTYAGPKEVAAFVVTLEATKPGKESCEIDVAKYADGSHRFFVRQREGKWDLKLPKDQKDGEMRCEVKEALRAKLCEPEKIGAEHSSPPLCDDANRDSPLCSGNADAN